MDRRRVLGGAASLSAWALAPAPASAAVMERFTSGGVEIEVELFAAAGAPASAPGLLLLHGAEGLTNEESYRFAAQSLAGSGYVVAFPHYLDRSGARRTTLANIRRFFPAWVETVRDALTWIGARPGVDPGRLGIVGVSLGAALGLETAAADPRVKALVDFFGPLPQGFAARRPRLAPTLILHGAADPVVPVVNAYALKRLLAESGTPHEMRIFPGQGHGFQGMAQLEAASEVSAFLRRHLMEAPGRT